MAFAKQEILHGIRNGEFVPYFQPIVELRSGILEGFEILARWNHPTGGLVPPVEFIPLIEQHGLMNDLSASILTQAFTAAQAVPSTISFSANVSPWQLHDRTLPALFTRIAKETSFDLRRLTVELTESALMDDLTLAGSIAADFKALGMRLSLDDFGTGYSSLLHLQALPFDELKVDISFVRSMVESRESRKITAAVISLGQSLGLRTVGEGIDSHRQVELLTGQGCNLGQGWLYGRPVPADRVAEILAQPVLGGLPAVTRSAEAVSSERGLQAGSSDRLSQLRAIYDAAPVGLCFLDCNLRHVNINQCLADMNGLPIEAHLGRAFSEILPGIYPLVESYLHRALKGEATLGVEIVMPPSSEGSPPPTVLTSFQPAHDETGEVIGISISLVDITLMKQNETALRDIAEHYRNTVELSPHIPWVADAAGRVLSISSRWQSFSGLTLEQSAGDGWLRHVDDCDIEEARRHWVASIQTGTPMDMEFRLRGADGFKHWMRTRSTPYRDDAGNITRWYGSIECVDDQKQLIDTLSQSEAMLRSVFNAAPAGLVLVEAAGGTVLNANPRAQTILGCNLSTGSLWTGFPWQLFDTAGNLVPILDLPLSRAIRLGESSNAVELRVCRSDHTDIWISATAAPVLSKEGAIVGGVLAVMEIDMVRREQIARSTRPARPKKPTAFHMLRKPKRAA